MNKERALKLDEVPEDVQRQVIILREPPNNWSYPKLSGWLKDTHGIDCSHLSVQKWVERRRTSVVRSIYGDKIFMKRAQEEYGKILGEYFKSIFQLTNLLRTVCRSREDLSKRSQMAVSLMAVIKDCVATAKDVVVGNASVEQQVVDLESDIQKLVSEVGYQMPVVSVIDHARKDAKKEEE